MTLKDRQIEQTEDEELWYDRAFGPLRNIMRVKFHFNPPPDAIGTGSKYEFQVKFKYTMFSELVEEFGTELYPAEQMVVLDEELDENDNLEWIIEKDIPYGEYTTKLLYKKLGTAEGEEGHELKELPEGLDEKWFKASNEPSPISEADQKKFDEEEEKQNKQKEQNARLAQKELESKKAQQKVEAQMQLLKQEQNSAKLKVYFSVMNLYFHK